MPELPEVETVKNQLAEILLDQPAIKKIKFYRKDLRHPLPIKKLEQLQGRKITSVERRAKYLLFRMDNGFCIISHLGMSGSWRKKSTSEIKRTHDHIELHLEDGTVLVYNDPRRFGVFDLSHVKDKSKWLNKLGPEPLSEEFNEEYLTITIKQRTAPIKNLIMDQKIVVGVGNIYASEALFLAGIRPNRASNRLKKAEVAVLLSAIKKTLSRAIEKGGSTIRDYKSLSESSGEFQAEHNVYDRERCACKKCHTLIKSKVFAGRSTFWCPSCQK